MPCASCGVEAPTRYVRLKQDIGMIFIRQSVSLERELCRPCFRRYFRSFSLTTLFLGWWGLLSFFATPFCLICNLREYWKTKDLPEPGIGALDSPITLYGSAKFRGAFLAKLIYGSLMWGLLLSLVAAAHVSLVERHAPALNAFLHRGSITNEHDGEYASIQIGKDVSAIEADVKGPWREMRSQILARRPYLVDLIAQNARIQQRVGVERAGKIGANDPCEQWALGRFAPALNHYTAATTRLFALTSETSEDTIDSAAFHAAANTQDQALQAFQQVSSEGDAHACKK